MKILTITPNPAIDLTVGLEKLVSGEVHRAQTAYTRAGGKGVNVSSNLAGYGIAHGASGFLGRANADIFERHLASLRVQDAFVRVDGENRTNIKIVDAAGTTDVNLRGFSVAEEDVRQLLATVDSVFSRESGVAVLSGSLPPGAPPDLYRTLTAKLKALGCTVFLDADGTALKSALSAAVLPDCIKPNIRELSEWLGRPLNNWGEIRDAAQELLERGVQLAVVSGGSEGALFVDHAHALLAHARPARIASTVGAGDAMMSGMVCAWAAEPERRDEPAARLEGIARMATAFAIHWLENSAHGETAPQDPLVFQEQLAALMGKVAVDKL